MLLAAVGVDAEGNKHQFGVMEGATENAVVVQALVDNLTDRGLDPKVCRPFIVDGAKALRKAIRRTFGKHTPIQRCQIHKGNRGTTTGTQVAGSPNAGGQTGDGNNRACANQAGRRRALT